MAFLSHNTNDLFITFLIFCTFYSCYSSTNNAITSSKSLKDNETITSNNTDLKLGFFSPLNSTNRYLGIWYINETNNIWIANRDQSLKDSNGIVTIHKDGNLVILNKPNGSIIWSTNISTSTNSTAQLADSGNLILRDINSGATIWDSFTHPADAAVPSMKIASNKVTGKQIAFVSRKSDNDPSSGHFTISVERLEDVPEVFIWKDKKIYWRTGPWNGRVFLGTPRMTTEYLFGWRLGVDDDGTTFITYNFADKTMFGILSLTPHGTLKLIEYKNKKELFRLEVDQNECDFYGKCGPFGNCDNSSVPNICSCFKGFEPKNLVEWSSRNWTNGCVRTAGMNLKCEMLKTGSNEFKQDGFLVNRNMKVPDFNERSDGNQDKCRTDCLANCTCLAYAYDPSIGCMYWSSELIDLQKFPYGGADLFIRVPAEVLSLGVDKNECDFYGKCGSFGNCDNSSVPICSCLEGFQPKNLVEWSLRNWANGCVRKEGLNLKCKILKNGSSEVQQDGFLVHNNMKVPFFAERSYGNQDKCRTDCLVNCSCLAYAYDRYIGCVYWSGDLIGLQNFPHGGVDLFIRVPAELVKKEKGHKKGFLIISIAGGTGAFTLVVCAYLLWLRRSARHKGRQSRNLTTRECKQMKLDELPLYDFEKLETATNSFHFNNMLGKGGFGPVYKGVTEDGQEIAVKRLSKASGQGIEEFMNEVVVISKLQHRNLVRLLGCCVERGEKMLVYEFMPNKSLDAFLFDPIQKKKLDWRKRSNIVEGIARGIMYLHRDSRLKIIHRDLKASNILLDDEMIPKISDFGLARIVKGGEGDEANTKRVVGTYGYMPPEYAMGGLFSEKSDVYSFGVLLLEIVSGRRNNSFYQNEDSLSLVGFAWKLWLEENTISLIDREVWDASFESSMLRCMHIGLLCVQELPKERPSISTVVLMLISEITHLPPPGKVAFVHNQNSRSTESSQQSHRSNSNNNVTLSDVIGR